MSNNSRPIRFLIVGPRLSRNLGGPSIILGIRKVLCEQFDDYELSLANTPLDAAIEKKHAKAANIEHVTIPSGPRNWLTMLPKAFLARFLHLGLTGSSPMAAYLSATQKADIIVEAYGIRFADQAGGNSFVRRFIEGQSFGVAKILGKFVVQYTADFGPFNLRWNRLLARFWMGRCTDFILCRNKLSQEYLTEIGIPEEKTKCAPDTGFLMPAHDTERSSCYIRHNEKGLVAVGVSYQVRNRFPDPNSYDKLMMQLVKHIIRKHKCHVLLIPNEIRERPHYDDLTIALRVGNALESQHASVVQAQTLTGPEMKSIIGNCDAVVSSRYHTLVASLSMQVPSIAIGWHHKYKELFDLFEMGDDWVFDYSVCGLEELKSCFDILWAERDKLHQKLNDSLGQVEESIQHSGETVASIIKNVTADSDTRTSFQERSD